ncbi:hypothetical protein BS50DRAFT_261319 [Corynespora cassiicola Philippines]|uniref:Uncharacterized protein n=1 Tax=Corynespora cassiicola Philippines TaxID=1448308 RepID=A0A2T2N1B1_CORCC|nr:hypothetical protein BS50DRAFT_261319 [Corynespora cassiicola Philippines]
MESPCETGDSAPKATEMLDILTLAESRERICHVSGTACIMAPKKRPTRESQRVGGDGLCLPISLPAHRQYVSQLIRSLGSRGVEPFIKSVWLALNPTDVIELLYFTPCSGKRNGPHPQAWSSEGRKDHLRARGLFDQTSRVETRDAEDRPDFWLSTSNLEEACKSQLEVIFDNRPSEVAAAGFLEFTFRMHVIGCLRVLLASHRFC